jgi:hypothetical protein
VILDACRNNPFKRSMRSLDRGLAVMDAPTGTVIAYSTAPGEVAADGDGRDSPYSSALATAMRQSNEPVEQVFKHVRVAVLNTTNGKQTPWEASSLTGDFYFASAGKLPSPGKTWSDSGQMVPLAGSKTPVSGPDASISAAPISPSSSTPKPISSAAASAASSIASSASTALFSRLAQNLATALEPGQATPRSTAVAPGAAAAYAAPARYTAPAAYAAPMPRAQPSVSNAQRASVGLDPLADITRRLRAQAAVEGRRPPAQYRQ